MKKLTCSDLGGPAECSAEITGETFEEIGNNCKAHVMAELQKGDATHQAAVEKMASKTPEEMQVLFTAYEKKFNEAEEV